MTMIVENRQQVMEPFLSEKAKAAFAPEKSFKSLERYRDETREASGRIKYIFLSKLVPKVSIEEPVAEHFAGILNQLAEFNLLEGHLVTFSRIEAIIFGGYQDLKWTGEPVYGYAYLCFVHVPAEEEYLATAIANANDVTVRREGSIGEVCYDFCPMSTSGQTLKDLADSFKGVLKTGESA